MRGKSATAFCRSPSARSTAAWSAGGLIGVELAVDLDPHDRLAQRSPARVRDPEDAAVRVTLDADHRVQQQPDTVALRGDRLADRVHEERGVGQVDLERGSGGRRRDHAHGDRIAPLVHHLEQVHDLSRELLGRQALQPVARGALEQRIVEGQQRLASRARLRRNDRALDLLEQRVRAGDGHVTGR